jgi:hypothetical protein
MSTTVRVSTSTREAVRALAAFDGVTIDETIARLARRERQRRMGEALASPGASDERHWLDLAVDVHGDDDARTHDASR